MKWSGHGMTPARYLRFFGMQRAGNHAVINGILRNVPDGKSVFLNNCGAYKKPFQSLGALVVNGEIIDHKNKPFKPLVAPAGTTPVLAMSYENLAPEFSEDRSISGNFNDTMFSHNILIMRSFTNWYASLSRLERTVQRVRGQAPLTVDMRLLRFVKQYQEFLESAARLSERPDVLMVIFDRWVTDAEYRQDILRRLGLGYEDLDLGAIQRFGAGSSFEKFSGNPTHMALTERWQALINDTTERPILMMSARDPRFRAAVDAQSSIEIERLNTILGA